MSAAQSRVVADRYRLVEPLGQGGMGRVWMARDELLHRDVAIKELIPPPGLTDDERQEMRERAMREARAIARLSHPNVVRIFDILRTEGEPWIVMEYVRSRSLQEVLAQDGPLPARRVAEIGLGMLAALRAAHRSGVVHRDVKPGNVLLGDDGRVVLTDFGLATVPGDPVVTRTGLVLGSPAYISPERAHDGTAGPAADMWSLGATLYAAVEGQSPYARPSAIATLAALATEPPAPPRRAGPLKPVLLGLLRKDPAERIMAKEAERLLMRAAGRRTRPGVPLLPGARRPFAEGYLPAPRIAPGAPPVVAAVAPVPPPRRPKPEPERPVDPAKDAQVEADAPAVEAPAAEAPAADAPATESGGETRSEPGTPGTAGPDQLATTLKEPAGLAADGAEPAESTTEPEAGAEPEQAAVAEPAPPVEQATAVDMEPVVEPAPQADAPESGPARVAGSSPEPAPTAGRTSAPVQPARRTPATASAAVTAIEPAVRDAPSGRPAPADRARAMSSALADRARSVPARTRAVVAGVVAVVALAVLLIVVLSSQDGDNDPKAGGGPVAPTQKAPASSGPTPGSGSTSAPTAAPTQNPPSPEAEPTGAAVAPPAGWRRYRGPGGFSVLVPTGWQMSRDDSRVEFREQGGDYRVLIIDQSDTPKADPVKDWTQQEAQRAYLKRNYHRIRIQKIDYFLAAADWEYTYDLAAPLHAINRGFVTGPHQAHAILWITPERTWKAHLDEFDLITRSFVPNPE